MTKEDSDRLFELENQKQDLEFLLDDFEKGSLMRLQVMAEIAEINDEIQELSNR